MKSRTLYHRLYSAKCIFPEKQLKNLKAMIKKEPQNKEVRRLTDLINDTLKEYYNKN